MNLFCFKLQLLGKDTYYFSNRSYLIVIFAIICIKSILNRRFGFFKLYFLNDKVKWLGNEFNENISINQSKKG